MQFHIWFTIHIFDSLLHNATAILLQNSLGSLLQIGTVLLQIATVMTKFVDYIAKCDSYYKMCHLLQNASVQWLIQTVVRKEKREHMKDLSY